MEWINALILGIIQGLTEFLPVSSSGHIELGKVVLNYEVEEDVLMTVVLHFATVLSTIVVFRHDIAQIFKGLFQFKWNDELRFSLLIILSMIPVGLVYVFFKDELDLLFDGNLLLIGAMLWVTALLLGFTPLTEKRLKDGGNEVRWPQAILIGIAQAIAVLPGISRSGSTIAIALYAGVGKVRAARFSFLMVLPPIIGGTLLEVKEVSEQPQLHINWLELSIGFVAAFFMGWLACRWMIRLVKRGQLLYFALYCAVVGSIAIFAHYAN